ncbi:MAG: protein kinase [Myxococcales bacterium]|nr:protein kinase [Myxococcales bacterium]MBK7198162.1 protein kinase [Myxococcales bacterium]MBP6845916.1 protein kinase [Kofleriaceae bacterium]
MAAPRLVIFDPAGRLGDVANLATRIGAAPAVVGAAAHLAGFGSAPVLVPSSAADALAAVAPTGARWVLGEGDSAGKVASAAVKCGAVGVAMAPLSPEGLTLICAPPPVALPEVELARARSLIAASVLDGKGEPTADGLALIARAFAADDCVFWWREGDGLVPWSTRASADADQAALGIAARVAAATGLTTVTTGTHALSVIAAPLATGPQEVGGLIAVVADRARRFGGAEVADLRALATRLPRELAFRAGHRRLVSDHERLLASAGQDPLTGALTRHALEQEVAAALTAARASSEPVALALLDVVGMRKLNLERGHRVGDEVLVTLAARLKAAVRPRDRVARFAGDDLVVLMPDVDAARAEIAAVKLLARVGAAVAASDGDVPLTLRGAVTLLGAGERSGEAGFARLRAAVRGAHAGAIVVARAASRGETEAGAEVDVAAGVTTGTTLGGTYRILHELSRGAMGVVYRGEDLGLGRQVAIKVLRSDLASDALLVTRFRAEAAMLASLHHANLVQVYSLGEHEGDVYFVMELVEGQSLAEVLDAQHAAGQWLPLEAIAQVVLEIGDALDAMHAIGLIHRDVKPANVLLDRERDRAVLVDVGVAKRRGDDVDGAGTPGYAAPESFLEGGRESPETDVYGLAATVYCALTGRPPFGSGQLMQVIARQLHEPLPPARGLRPELPAAVDEILAKALDPAAEKRYASASTFAIALARALERAPRIVPGSPEASTTVKPEAVLRQTERLGASARPASVQSMQFGMVRAAHFRVGGRVIAHLAGDAAVRAVADGDPMLASALSASTPVVGWLPLELLIELVLRAEPHTRKARPPDGGEHLMRAIGRSTVSATFARFFGADPATLGVSAMLAVLPSMWNRYHGWCRCALGPRSAAGAEVIIDGEATSPLAWHLVEAELGKACELAGAASVVVSRQPGAGPRQQRVHLAWSSDAVATNRG